MNAAPAPPDALSDASPDASADAPSGIGTGFVVRLHNFEGPFDLLLQLIGKHKLDVTEVALSKVTDEFIGYIRAMGAEWDLGQATEFLVVASTLLDLKAARLLPSGDVEDEEDLALLEARDLLFARLLQYRAYKQVAALVGELARTAAQRYPRAVSLEPRYAEALPEVRLDLDPEEFARLAAVAMRPKPQPEIGLDHVHSAQVSVREQAAVLRERLARSGTATFRALVADCRHTLEVVGRFLALLELYREQVVAFEQVTPLGELHVRWTADAHDQNNADPAAGASGESDPDEEYG